jgi:hypothetical protein
LAQAERHVARQQEIIDHLAREGYPTDLAFAVLRTFALTLATHRRHREQIAAELADESHWRGSVQVAVNERVLLNSGC